MIKNHNLYGKRIDEFRRSKGYTQQELADLCNVSPKIIQVITIGNRKSSFSLFAEICIHLDMPTNCFLREERKSYALGKTQIEKLKKMPADELKQLLALVRSLSGEFKFVGLTSIYVFIQSIGMVNLQIHKKMPNRQVRYFFALLYFPILLSMKDVKT